MIPAHKQTVPNKYPGQQVYPVEQTLGDYINRKHQINAFDVVNKERKLTFDEWFNSTVGAMNTEGIPYNTIKQWFAAVWKTAQENK